MAETLSRNVMELVFPDERRVLAYPNVPAARRTDTSEAAAQEMREHAQNVRDMVLDALRRKPMTVHECAKALRLPVPTVQPRFSELRRMDEIVDTGLRRVNAVSGKRAAVWGVGRGES